MGHQQGDTGRHRAPLQRHSPQSRDPKRVQILQESPHVILAAGAVQVLQEGSRWAPGRVRGRTCAMVLEAET